MLVNVGPDRRGLFPDPDRESQLAFGQELKARFGSPLNSLVDFTREGDRWSYGADEPFLLDTLMIQESIEAGESVERFRIAIDSYKGGKPIAVYEGTSIGHKAIASFPLVRAVGVHIEILEPRGPVELKSLSAFCTARAQEVPCR
jgi:alpha-L-fucosidase